MREDRSMKTIAGVVAATAGALLVVSLLLPWWGVPPVFLDPPSDASEEIKFAAEGFEGNGTGLEQDAFRFFGIKDLLWLFTGVAGFGFGLFLLTRTAVSPAPGAVIAGLSVVSLVLVAAVIVSPPDYFEIARAEYGGGLDDADPEAPLGREPGAFVALAALLALGASAASTLRVR
jgi:hypothetical protein